MTQIAVLGPLVVRGVDGSTRLLASASQRRLVSAMCARPGTLVRSSTLEDALGLTAGALRTTVSRVRRIVGADALTSAPGGYELHADIDAVAFERLVHRALSPKDGSTHTDLDAALALWRGRPYDEFADEGWAHAEVHRLEELHAAAMETRIALLIDADECALAIDELSALIADHPYRDRPRALLMQALARTGRTTEALREFQNYRALLVDDIGTEPGADIVALDRAIAAEGRATSGHHNLPAAVSTFVGRVSEIADVARLVRTHRLVTLTGAGGCGKTRLALRVASDAIDGIFDDIRWVDLALISEATELIEHVARAIDATADPLRGLLDHLGGERSTLLVLDNAEHLAASTAALLGWLLRACPNTRVLVTSRQVLNVEGEVVWRVPSLSLPPSGATLTFDVLGQFDAVALFLERARAGRRGLVVNREVLAHVESICAGVDGMPLALELAAAQVRTSPISDVARGIAEIPDWSGPGSGTPNTRHGTLRASIAWSLDLLDDADRRVLARIALFRAPFTREAAVAVGARDGDVAGVAASIDRLVDASLLQLDDGSERYRMLETVRQYCTDHELDEAETYAARIAHATYFATWCTEVGDGRRGIEEQRFSLDMPDVVDALAWARAHRPRLALQICTGLASLWSALARAAATTATWEWLVSLDRDEVGDAEWASAVAALMAWATTQGATRQGLVVDGLARRLSLLLPETSLRARGWLERGAAIVPAFEGRMQPIVSYTRAVAARGDDLELSIYAGFAAYMLALVGRLDEADHWLGELRRLTRRHQTTFAVETIGNGYAAAIVSEALRGDLRVATRRRECAAPTGSVFALTAAAALGQVALWTRDPDTMQCAVEWSRRPTVPMLACSAPLVSCAAATLDDEVESAADHAEDFAELAPRVPVYFVQGWPTCNAALLAGGRLDVAHATTERAASLVDGMESAPFSIAAVHLCRAQIAAHRADIGAADRFARDALRIAAACRFELLVVDSLELIAAAAACRGETAVAGALAGATEARRRELGYRFRASGAARARAPIGAAGLTISGAIDLVRTTGQ